MSNNQNSPSGSNNHTDQEIEHSSVTTEMNVEFVEQQPLVSEDARLGHSLQSLPQHFEAAMPDDTWLAAKQLSKPVVIRQFQWATSATPGALLNSFDFPLVITENDSIHQETLSMYSFFKFNWTLRFQLNGTKFHSGQLIVSWDPFTQAGATTHRPFTMVYATGLPNVLLNASSNEPVQMTIPFVHPRNFLTTNSSGGFDHLGTVRVSVLNPLFAATGSSSSLSVTTWLYADSPSVHVPIYRHTLLIPELAEASMDRVKGLFSSNARNLMSDVGSTFGNLATGNFGGAIKSGGASLTGLAKMLGLDYPTRPIVEQSHINPLGPMSPGKGVDSSYRLGLDPRGGSVPLSDRTGATCDECDMDFIKKVPMLFRQVGWNDSQTVGTILTSFPVTPNICALTSTQADNTFLSWFSNAFAFWRGSLSYKFEWVSTQFHTGRVLVAFVPNYFTTDPTLQQAFSCPNVVIDLQQSSVSTVTVPYISPTLWKRTDAAATGTTDDDRQVGFVYVFILNSLVRPSNVAANIEFNIYIQGEDDFEFAVPRANPLSVYQNPPTELAERSTGADRMQTRTSGQSADASTSLTFGSALIPKINTFGETFPLVDYMKRYGMIFTSPLITTPGVYYLINAPSVYNNGSGIPTITPPTGTTQLTPLTTVTSVFACWFGSLRYKFATDINRTISGSLTVTVSPLNSAPVSFAGSLSGSGNAFQRTNLSQNNSLDFEVPCYTPYNLLLTEPTTVGFTPSLNTDAGLVACNVVVPTGVTYVFDEYQAAGDDFRPFYLISPPADFVTPTSYHTGITLRP